MTQKHYFGDPLKFEFIAKIVEQSPNENATSNIILDETYFYPTGGGQSHDLGTINNHKILDVHKEAESVIHVIDGQIDSDQATCCIDEAYRRGNMAAHTGQHILSAACLRELHAETLAVKMSATNLSTVDIAYADLDQSQIENIERLVNRVITQCREVKSYFVAPDSPKLEELRRAVKFDKVSGDVRLVEITDFDLSACAGTHYPNTGMLGQLKILKVENYKGGSRIHFVAGELARQQFGMYQQTLDSVANLLSSGADQVPELVQKLQFERSDLSKQVAEKNRQLLSYEAQTFLEQANNNYIIKILENRDNNDAKTLANLLANEYEQVVVFANQTGADLSLIIATPETSDIHAGNTLRSILAEFDGRGGGRDHYAQGVLKNFNDINTLVDVIKKCLEL